MLLISIHLRSLKIFMLCFGFYCLKAQNLVQNGSFAGNLNYWMSSANNCPAAGSSQFQHYNTGMVAGLPASWEGSAFLLNNIMDDATSYAGLSQNIIGLVPAPGNVLKLRLDVKLSEGNNTNAGGNPAQYFNDEVILEVYLNNIKYASVQSTKGWLANGTGGFGKAIVNYYNGATSDNYAVGESMNTIAPTMPTGANPSQYIGINSDWHIDIPWACDKAVSAMLEFRVKTNTYIGKTVENSLGNYVTQTCPNSPYTILDNVAVDNVVIENMTTPATPEPLQPQLLAANCSQTSFNLHNAMPALSNCTQVEYVYFSDINKTQEISNPGSFTPSQPSQTIYAFLAIKANNPIPRVYSAIGRSFVVVKNPIGQAGTIGYGYTICSNAAAQEIVSISNPNIQAGALYTYQWEVAPVIGASIGSYQPAGGMNDNLSYIPNALSTPNETTSKYAFRRKLTASYLGLSCVANTAPVQITVEPCAPISTNVDPEIKNNPGGTAFVSIPKSQWQGVAGHQSRNITQIRLIEFPKNAAALKISASSAGGRSLATVYCDTPADPSCTGVPFPTNGILLTADTNGQPNANLIEVDPSGDGSFQIDAPYILVDNLGFTSTNSNASILLVSSPLPVSLKSFETELIENKVKLTWETAGSKNFSHFEIEQSKDAKNFEKVAQIAENSTEKYEYQSQELQAANYYIRLKMVDTDGKFNYSNVKHVRINHHDSAQIIVKNSPNSALKFVLHAPKGNYQFMVFDLKGKLVSSQKSFINSANDEIQLGNVLNTGLYILQVNGFEQAIHIRRKVAVLN